MPFHIYGIFHLVFRHRLLMVLTLFFFARRSLGAQIAKQRVPHAEVAAYQFAGMRGKRRHEGATSSAAAIWGGDFSARHGAVGGM